MPLLLTRAGPSVPTQPLGILLAALGSAAKGVFTSPETTTTLVSGGVSVWADQSGTGNLTCAANRPTLSTESGRTWVRWSTTSNPLARAAMGVGPNFELFLRLRYASPSGGDMSIVTAGGATNDWGVSVRVADTSVRALRTLIAAATNTAPTLAASTTGIVHVVGSGNTTWAAAWAGAIDLDGGSATASNLGYAEGDGLNVSPNQNGSTAILIVSDLILYTPSPDAPTAAAQQQAVRDYLAAT